MKVTSTAITAERKGQKDRNEWILTLESARFQESEAFIYEQGREAMLRRWFFRLYIASSMALAGWGIYLWHLYAMQPGPKNDNLPKIPESNVVYRYDRDRTPIKISGK